MTRALLSSLGDPERVVRETAARVLASRDDVKIGEELVTRIGDADHNVRDTAARALADRDRPGELLALAAQVRSFHPPARESAYKLAERMAARVYQQIPPESQVRLRAELSWLTAAVLRSQRA